MAEMFGFYKIDAFEHKCWWSDKLGWGEKKDVTLFPRLMRIGDLLDHNYQNTVLMLNSNSRAETHIFGPNEQLAVGLAKAAKDNPADPYLYSQKEIEDVLSRSNIFESFIFRHWLTNMHGKQPQLKAKYPIRLDGDSVGWVYQMVVSGVPQEELADYDFIGIKWVKGKQVQQLVEKQSAKTSDRIEKLGINEYLALVFQAQEGSNG